MSVNGPESVPAQRSPFRRHSAETAVWHTTQNRQAARAVAGRALDAEDCQSLLEMLGLTADDGKPEGLAAL